MWATPSLAADGSVIVGSDDGHVYALSSSGQQRWNYSTRAAAVDAPVAIDGAGNVFVTAWDGSLAAVNGTTGAAMWRIVVDGSAIQAAPAIASDGSLVVATTAGNVWNVKGMLPSTTPTTTQTGTVTPPATQSPSGTSPKTK